MRNLYTQVDSIINTINFNSLWTGFNKSDFALYDKEYVYLKDKTIPYDDKFIGNTRITYEEKELAIWYIDDINNIEVMELASNIVHEMFHSYQILNKETRFPNDIKALAYPNDLHNYSLKYQEGLLLIEALNSIDTYIQLDILNQIIASRLYRLRTFGKLIRYELLIETIEGSAEYCSTKALKYLSEDLYLKRIKNYKSNIKDTKLLFDIRRSCYFTGTLFLLLLDELDIDFSKDLKSQNLTLFEEVAKNLDVSFLDFKKFNVSEIQVFYNEEQCRIKDAFNDFFNNEIITTNGNFYICGYDPMNMTRLESKVLCSHFIILFDIYKNDKVFIKGPVVIEFDSDFEKITTYYSINN